MLYQGLVAHHEAWTITVGSYLQWVRDSHLWGSLLDEGLVKKDTFATASF